MAAWRIGKMARSMGAEQGSVASKEDRKSGWEKTNTRALWGHVSLAVTQSGCRNHRRALSRGVT